MINSNAKTLLEVRDLTASVAGVEILKDGPCSPAVICHASFCKKMKVMNRMSSGNARTRRLMTCSSSRAVRAPAHRVIGTTP